jgi:pheromone shutdown protein TraB
MSDDNRASLHIYWLPHILAISKVIFCFSAYGMRVLLALVIQWFCSQGSFS